MIGPKEESNRTHETRVVRDFNVRNHLYYLFTNASSQNGSKISNTKLTKILYINASTINIQNLESSQWFS